MRRTPLEQTRKHRKIRRAKANGHRTASTTRQSKPPARSRPAAPRTAERYFAMSEHAQDRWTRVTHVITKMRAEDISLQQASREYGLDPRTVARLARPALGKRANGRYAAKTSDRLLRVLVVPSREGPREVAVRDSRQASQLAEYANAVHKYLDTGDSADLRKLRRKSVVDANGKRVRLLTNLAELDRLGSAGVLSFESLYAKAS